MLGAVLSSCHPFSTKKAYDHNSLYYYDSAIQDVRQNTYLGNFLRERYGDSSGARIAVRDTVCAPKLLFYLDSLISRRYQTPKSDTVQYALHRRELIREIKMRYVRERCRYDSALSIYKSDGDSNSFLEFSALDSATLPGYVLLAVECYPVYSPTYLYMRRIEGHSITNTLYLIFLFQNGRICSREAIELTS